MNNCISSHPKYPNAIPPINPTKDGKIINGIRINIKPSYSAIYLAPRLATNPEMHDVTNMIKVATKYNSKVFA